MLRQVAQCSRVLVSRRCPYGLFRAAYSNGKGVEDTHELTPKQKEDRRKEAQKVLSQSFKDISAVFSTGGSEDATQPIDTKPIFKNPRLFAELSLLHQGQVVKELQDKFDKKWHKLDLETKKLAYFIAYGDWGVREKFANWDTSEPPYDLPFPVPSQVKTTSPEASTIVKKIDPPVNLAETPVRREQFQTKSIDAITRFFIYLTVLIAMLAIYRDKNIGEEGKPLEISIHDSHEAARLQKLKDEEENARIKEQKQEQGSKNWYYLWLK